MFDTSVVQSIFPDGEIRQDGREVNGLPNDVKPLSPGGRILVEANSNYSIDRRFYIVITENHATMLRVCKAYPNSGYDKYAVISKQCAIDDFGGIIEMITETYHLTGVLAKI